MDRSSKLFISLLLCAAAAAAVASAAPPPTPPPLPPPITVVPAITQQRVQTQLSIQQAQAQARFAASQAQVQANLDADQARLQAQFAAQEAGTQARLDADQRIAAAGLSGSWLPVAGSLHGPVGGAPGNMQLITLTPQLGRYFGTDRGVLVVRAPTHGVLKLKDGDVILAIGGRTPTSSSQAIRILTSYDPGDEIRLTILREHRKMELTATLPPPPRGP